MLPSFRLIVAAFLCGFVVVFAGLRLAATMHHVHASMPIMAAHAAPLAPSTLAMPPVPRLATPIVYDLRFVGNNAGIAALPVNLTPTAIEIAAPDFGNAIGAVTPLPVPADARPDSQPAVAAIDPDVTTRATPDEPLTESEARFEPPPAEPPAANEAEKASPNAPAATTEPAAPAIDPKPESEDEPAATQAASAVGIENASPAAPAHDAPRTAAATEPSPASEAEAASETPAARPETDGRTASGDMPPTAPVASPVPKPQATEPTQRTAAKPAPKKKRARTARRAARVDPFGFPF